MSSSTTNQRLVFFGCFLERFLDVNIFENTSCGYLACPDAPGDERELHAPMEAAEWGKQPQDWWEGLIDHEIRQYGGFLKWWYPTTMGFPTKNDHFGVFWGYHHFRKPIWEHHGTSTIPSLKLTASLHLKMDGWSTTFLFFGGLFSGAILVSGRVTSWSNYWIATYVDFCTLFSQAFCFFWREWIMSQ